jgi:hypothetical protein
MSSTLDKIIREVQQLPLDEQRRLVEQLNAIVPSSPSADEVEERAERQLAAEGLIRLPASGAQAPGRFNRINVAGQPVSEMIVEERR